MADQGTADQAKTKEVNAHIMETRTGKTWEEYRDKDWLCSYEVRKAFQKLELNLARDIRNNKKGFYRYVN